MAEHQPPDVVQLEADWTLLQEAAAWPGLRSWPEVQHAALAELAGTHGVDFATAVLYDRVYRSTQHGPFIRRITELLPLPQCELDVLLAVVPGAFYREAPESGADGALLREHAAAWGCRTALIPTHSTGSVAENGRIIRDWLAERRHERIVLASLSKGAADIKAALAARDGATAFRPVVAWLNLSGLPAGTPVASWIRQGTLRQAAFRTLAWWRGIDFDVVRELAWGSGTALDLPLALPPHVQLISVVGFPLQHHFTSRVLRYFHRRIAHLGPNDGLMLLADACALPGLIYPVWCADHRLRPPGDVRGLVGALAQYLAETLPTVAAPLP